MGRHAYKYKVADGLCGAGFLDMYRQDNTDYRVYTAGGDGSQEVYCHYNADEKKRARYISVRNTEYWYEHVANCDFYLCK